MLVDGDSQCATFLRNCPLGRCKAAQSTLKTVSANFAEERWNRGQTGKCACV